MNSPTVTQVLAPWCDFSQVPSEVLDVASLRGTRVHAACAAWARGEWGPALPEEFAGYFQSFADWFTATVAEVVAVEIELRHPAYDYLGHPDLISRFHGDTRLTVVDYKTPAGVGKTWPAQLAAYRELGRANRYDVARTGSLRLKKDGSRAIFNEFTPKGDEIDWALQGFMYALGAYRIFRGGNL